MDMDERCYPCCDHCDHPDVDEEGAVLDTHGQPCPNGCDAPGD